MCVVESLAKKVGLQASPLSSKSANNSHGICEVTKQLVQAFYITDAGFHTGFLARGGKRMARLRAKI